MTTTLDTLLDLQRLASTLHARIGEAIVAIAMPPAEPVAALCRGTTPAAIVRLLRERGEMSTPEIYEAFRDAGREVSTEAIAQALVRLSRSGRKVRRVRRGVYGPVVTS